MKKLVLASSSLGRKRLLEYLKIPFEIIHSNLDEDKIVGKTPLETLQLRARLKGKTVAQKTLTRRYPLDTSRLILSADSGAILADELIGKPKTRKDAVKILQKLSGKTHNFITSVYIIRLYSNKSKGKETVYNGETESRVTFRKLSREEIDFYLDHTGYKRFAASYALISAQDFITRVEGSLSNVIGLPLEVIIPLFKSDFKPH